jgi:hypothetical protein
MTRASTSFRPPIHGPALLDGAPAARGGALVQVKTLGPSRPNAHYARTRAFYARRGYLPVEEFTSLWPSNRCLLLSKAVTATRESRGAAEPPGGGSLG